MTALQQHDCNAAQLVGAPREQQQQGAGAPAMLQRAAASPSPRGKARGWLSECIACFTASAASDWRLGDASARHHRSQAMPRPAPGIKMESRQHGASFFNPSSGSMMQSDAIAPPRSPSPVASSGGSAASACGASPLPSP
jgi:hypothetical protein